ncbi:P27 family phage terminase small subunit [Clostridioides difficile]
MSEAKPIELVLGHRTKQEIQNRKENQERLKGDSSRIIPTQKLNENEISIFNSIKEEMKNSELLSNLDSYLLTQLAGAIDKLEYLDLAIQKKPTLIFNKEFKNSKKLYFDIFTKCCNELAMSPASRAKLANINSMVAKEQEDPVIKAIGD